MPGAGRAACAASANARIRLVEVDHRPAVAVRAVLLFGYVARVHVRGRLARSPSGGRPRSRWTGAAGRAARPGRAARAARPRRARRGRAELQRLDRGPAGARRRGRRRPAAAARSADRRRGRGPRRDGERDRGRWPGSLLARRPPGRPGADGRRAERWAAIEDVGRLRDALGVPVPVGIPTRSSSRSPIRSATWSPATPAPTARSDRRGCADGSASASPSCARRAARGSRAAGPRARGRVPARPAAGSEWCDAEVLRRLRRRSLAALRQEVEPVEPARWARSCRRGSTSTGRPRCAGSTACSRWSSSSPACAVPASALESLVLPAGCADYQPALLDELTATGEVLWAGHGSLPGADGWVSLHLADTAPLTLPDAGDLEIGPTPPGDPRRPRRRRRLLLPPAHESGHRRRALDAACGSWSGPAASPTTRSPRCAR